MKKASIDTKPIKQTQINPKYNENTRSQNSLVFFRV